MSGQVLLLTNDHDFAADRVVELLRERGTEVDRWHLGSASTDPGLTVTWRPEDPPAVANYDSVWLRQFLPEMEPAQTLPEVDDLLVTREQWRTWLSDCAEAPAVRWMNPLWAARRAENKLLQLREARVAGLSVPATVVTNSRAVAAAHAAKVGPCVVKTVAGAFNAFSDSSFVFTRPLKDALQASEQSWAEQPLVVQQEISLRVDVRVIVVGDHMAAAATQVAGSDWRLSSADAAWTGYQLDDAKRDACLRLVSQLGLVYGALDFADDGNQLWFLECNQAGEFAFIDTPPPTRCC